MATNKVLKFDARLISIPGESHPLTLIPELQAAFTGTKTPQQAMDSNEYWLRVSHKGRIGNRVKIPDGSATAERNLEAVCQ